MSFKPRMGVPFVLILAGLIGYFAYNGDTKLGGFDLKNLSLIVFIGGIVWLVIELLTSRNSKKSLTDRTITQDAAGRQVETRHEREKFFN